MKKYLLLLMAGLILTAPNVFAEDDEEIPQDPPETTDPPIKIPINNELMENAARYINVDTFGNTP